MPTEIIGAAISGAQDGITGVGVGEAGLDQCSGRSF